MATEMATRAGTSETARLKERHRAMWASGDYPALAEASLLSLGPRLVGACGIGVGRRVLDVAAGDGNASLPAAAVGADVTASDLTPELLEAGRRRADAAGLALEWVPADAEALPFANASFDVVMSSIGVMFAPRHAVAAAELARVCRPGGVLGLLSWTPDGMMGRLMAALRPFAPPPPAGASPPALWGREEHLLELFEGTVRWDEIERGRLVVSAFARPQDYAGHLRDCCGLVGTARAHAARTGRAAELDAALAAFCEAWDRGAPGEARFELEFLVAVGTRRRRAHRGWTAPRSRQDRW